MKIEDIKANAFAMPLTSPAFPRGPYRFTNREFLVITYRTDMDALRAVVPEPLEISEPLVKNSSVCPTLPDLAITPNPAKSSRSVFVVCMAITRMQCT